MSSLLKNQILKHLSKFTKNLSPDRLNVSAIKGEGELSNLELDEEVLTDLLELPTWLKITRASCNRVAIKIQWTKLKSQPICLYLDEVVVEMETCETPRPPSASSNKSTLSPGGKYGFIDKVMDGIFVHVNSVIVKMLSRTFSASLQLSRVKVHSTTPTWGATNDLRTTRIRDTQRGEILVFKEIEWQTTRIEAAADESLSKEALTPLRLIANQAKIRVVLKKKLSDCSITASRVILLLDDLLWVLTVMQLKAAILYANSLKEVIERSAQQSKRLAAEKLKRQGIMTGGAAQQAQAQSTQQAGGTSTVAKYFTRFDVTTTSYHLVTSRFDLHLCDDTATGTDSTRHWDISNGSMQITFYRLSFDFYPFHPAGGERKSWYRYSDNYGTRNPWVQKLFSAFREDAMKIRKVCGSPNPSPSTSTTKISSIGTGGGSNNPSPSHSPSHAPSPSRSPSHHPGQQQQRQKGTRLLESCCVIKIEDLTIYMVSTPNTKRTGHQKFLVSDKKQLHLPADMSVVHMEYTEYYFPDGMDYPVPHPNLYVMVNPVKVTLDFLTLLWSQYFLFTLAQSVELDLGDQGPVEHVDIKLEALMPRVVVPSEVKVEGHPDRPDALQLQISKLIATNCRMDDNLTHNDLRKCLDAYYGSHLFHTAKFPNDALPFRLTPWQLENHASRKDNPYLDKAVKGLLEADPNHLQCQDTGVPHILSSNSLKMEAASDVWGLHLEQVWVEFLGVQNARNRPVPCVEAFPLTLWLGITLSPVPSNNEARLSVQSSNTLKSEPQKGSRCDSPLAHQPRMGQQEDYVDDSRPSHLPLSETKSSKFRCGESFEDCLSLQSEELTLQQPADETAFILPHFGAKMRMQVNHHQYLFLVRLSESFAKFQEELAEDLALWGSTKSRVVHLPLSIPDGELAIVCPYQMDQRTFSEDFSPIINTFPEVFSIPGSVASNNISGHGVLDATLVPEPIDGDLTNAAYQMEKDVAVDNNNIIPILNCDNDPSPTTMIGHHSPVTTGPHATFPPDLTAADLYNSTQPPPVSFTPDPKSQMSMSAGTDSGIGLDRKSSLKSGKSKGAEMKKAFSSAFSNFTDKIKNTFDDSISDDLDSLSLKTDTSDDDDLEQLSLDDTEEVPAFIHEGRSDTASNPDTYSDMDTSSIYADSSTTKGREMVSLVLVKLDGTEGLLQVCETCTMVAFQVSQVQLHQPGNVGYEDFYSKFSSAKGFVQEEKVAGQDSPIKFPIRFKFALPTSPPGSTTPHPPDPGLMTVRVEDYSLQFKMSGIAALTEFIEDEKVAQVVPMSVTVQNFLFVLDEDRPANSSSGGAPVNFHVEHLYMNRGNDGIFHITTDGESVARSNAASPCGDTDTMEARGPHTPSSISSLNLLTQTQAENSQLRRQCDELNRANKLYEEQIIIMRDKMREYELQVVALQQQQKQYQQQLQQQQHQHQHQQQHSHHNKHQPQSPRGRNHKLSSPGSGVGELPSAGELHTENLKLHEQVSHLEEDLLTAAKEKESLISTLQCLQEELLKSERRARSNTATY